MVLHKNVQYKNKLLVTKSWFHGICYIARQTSLCKNLYKNFWMQHKRSDVTRQRENMKILFFFSSNKRPQSLKVNKENDREEEEWLCVGETTYVTKEDFQTQLEYQMDAPCRSIFFYFDLFKCCNPQLPITGIYVNVSTNQLFIS